MQIHEVTEGILKGVSMDLVNRMSRSMGGGQQYSQGQIARELPPGKEPSEPVAPTPSVPPVVDTAATPAVDTAATPANPEVNYDVPAVWRKKQAQQGQQTQQQNPTAPAASTVAPPVTGALPSAGRRFRVSVPGSKAVYFKTNKGWTNEVGQSITKPESVNKLEQFLDAGSGKEETIPKAPVVPLKKGRRGARRGR